MGGKQSEGTAEQDGYGMRPWRQQEHRNSRKGSGGSLAPPVPPGAVLARDRDTCFTVLTQSWKHRQDLARSDLAGSFFLLEHSMGGAATESGTMSKGCRLLGLFPVLIW